jgi:hypothetical protein
VPGFATASAAGGLFRSSFSGALARAGLGTVVTGHAPGAGAGRGVASADALPQPNTERDADPDPESDPKSDLEPNPDAIIESAAHAGRQPNANSNTDLDARAVAQLSC